MYNKFIIRENCIFCNTKLCDIYFHSDYNNYCGHYAIPLDDFNNISIPFNIYICSCCKTIQNKYLGDLDEIYKINHADSTGKIMNTLHNKTANMLYKYKSSILNILEIGSSHGTLADLILDKFNCEYNIIEPCYKGSRTNKNIYDNYYENVDDTQIFANTLIISHVFEHFYKPLEILEKIVENKNIENFFLIWPNLEYYINNDILHVLNIEHTYYVDNNFLINLLKNYGFELIESIDHLNHSLIFYFKRINYEKQNVLYINNNYNLDKFYNNIFETIIKLNIIIDNNSDKFIYIWPASIHTIYLSIFGLNYNKLYGMLDNSYNKINKKMYGLNLNIYSFQDIINKNDPNTVILLNGGIFTNEIIEQIKKTNIKYYSDL
jgi:hypothetical protein